MTKNEKLTFAKVHAITGSELEQYAERGEASRSDLSREVVHALCLPEDWTCDIEYRSEFGGDAPVNVRLFPSAHPAMMLCLFSSSADVPFWRLCLPFDDGASVAWLYSSEQFEPVPIAAALDSVIAFVAAGLTTPKRVAVAMRQAGGAV
ncbi:conjugation system SOS inhibitor PsiB [Ewingella americana]|uniref:conjugation system SOS inhibitor PsiB n=1 Tax=Ewingella americana TaxID=41202 RepID=UPI0012ADD4D5|nr:conjugation system SOS inhibitor PsiB [Ewingella americana]MRT06068.1 conjugation system SOS inhibitor PsiB [Ewingella americana]